MSVFVFFLLPICYFTFSLLSQSPSLYQVVWSCRSRLTHDDVSNQIKNIKKVIGGASSKFDVCFAWIMQKLDLLVALLDIKFLTVVPPPQLIIPPPTPSARTLNPPTVMPNNPLDHPPTETLIPKQSGSPSAAAPPIASLEFPHLPCSQPPVYDLNWPLNCRPCHLCVCIQLHFRCSSALREICSGSLNYQPLLHLLSPRHLRQLLLLP